MSIQFSSALSDITEINPSFDAGKLRVAYTGKNRNNTFISKEAFERAVPTMFNVPVVANYNREDDELGSHDGEWIKDKAGETKYVMVTQPVGVVPESAQWYWEDVSDNGVMHQYFCTEVLLWKRQEAYQKIKDNGITKHSMEIEVTDGKMLDDYYDIQSFNYTAFCLLGTAEPCFESSALFTFSAEEQEDFKLQYTQMLKELKELGSGSKEEKEATLLNELLKKYSVTMEDIEFDVEGLSDEELEAKFVEVFDGDDPGDTTGSETSGSEETGGTSTTGSETSGSEETGGTSTTGSETSGSGSESGSGTDTSGSGSGSGSGGGSGSGSTTETTPEEPDYDNLEDGGVGEGQVKKPEEFGLNSQVSEALCGAVRDIEKIEDDWGSYPRYCFCDFDADSQQVYFIDMNDFRLYGCKYAMDGDEVALDTENIVRKKYEIVDFIEGSGEQVFALADVFNAFKEAYSADSIDADEFKRLQDFEAQVLSERRETAEQELFAEFENQLKDNDEFTALKEHAGEYSLDTLKEKLFALVGKMQFSATVENKPMPGIVFEEKPKNSSMRKLFAWKDKE